MLLCQCVTPSLVVIRCHVLEAGAACDMWSAYDEVTPAFCALAATPETVDDWLCPLERLLVLQYDFTSSPEFVNRVRKQCSPSRSLLGTDDDRDFGASISK